MGAGRPLVYGYVRMEEPDEIRIALLCKDIGLFSGLHGYRLGSVFIDRGVPDDVLARTGFVDLLDAVRLTGAHAVVVPTMEHLSADQTVQTGLLTMVRVAGCQVLAAYQATPPAGGMSRNGRPEAAH